MGALLAGTLPATAYGVWLAQLQRLYGALEQALESEAAGQALPGLGGPQGLVARALVRRHALAADLQAWAPAGASRDIPPSLQAYVQRLAALARHEPHRLLAHAYARYLGDLHGGQILARSVARLPGAPAQPGVAFYDFGSTARVLELRSELRALLGALVLAPGQADAVVAEAVWAFEQHVAWFEEQAAFESPSSLKAPGR
jgi:heme oxygenase